MAEAIVGGDAVGVCDALARLSVYCAQQVTIALLRMRVLLRCPCRAHRVCACSAQKFLGGSGGGGSKSALLGDFTPLAQAAAQPAGADVAASNATPPQTSAAPQCVLNLLFQPRLPSGVAVSVPLWTR